MKNSLKILVGSMMLVSAVALTACGGGGGGGSSDPGPGVGAYGVNGTTGYLGVGQWTGGLVGTNITSPQYQQFLYQFGNGSYTTIIRFSVWSGGDGMLPAQMGFKINGRPMGGDGFINGNGFLVNNYSGGYGGGFGGGYPGAYGGQIQCFRYPCQQQMPPVAQGTPVIQIVAQFVDACRTRVTIQLRYQNVIIATGTINGFVQQSPYGAGYPGMPGYNPAMAQCGMQPQYGQQQPYAAQQPYYDNY